KQRNSVMSIKKLRRWKRMSYMIEEKLISLLLDWYNPKIPRKEFSPLDPPLWNFLLKELPEKYQEISAYSIFHKKPTPEEIEEIIKKGFPIKREKEALKKYQKELGKILLKLSQTQTNLDKLVKGD
ncbi:MAG: hypothetical protein ACFFG0_52120, partial [Candidatus Thorarchaeota archaeon]